MITIPTSWLFILACVIIVGLILRPKKRRRPPIPQKVKDYVYQRDGGRCRHCGRHSDYMEYDHIKPWSKGGSNDASNLQLLCRRCNEAKGNRYVG
jgi:5-methylcytosine-specific restriction endonuclease McrA